MNLIVICLAALVVALSTLAKLNDLPKKGQHREKVGLALCGASAILIAVVTLSGGDLPQWLIAASLCGCALEKIATAPFNWFRWVFHGNRRHSEANAGPSLNDRRSGS